MFRSCALAVLLVGCAKHAPGTDPHAMPEAGHDAAAADHDAAADAHAAQYDPSAEEVRERCNSGRFGETCWTSVVNPTDAHLKQAEQERKIAAEHRAASAALAAAEAEKCAGLAPDDRDMSPFEHTEDIASVAPLVEWEPTGKGGPPSHVAGATVTFRAVPGLTAEWLQRIVDCHLARNAALGHVVPEMPDCPLVPNGAHATVASTGTGFAVAIRADDPGAAAEILARAQRLVPAEATLR